MGPTHTNRTVYNTGPINVVLDPDLYGKLKEVDGWYVHAPDPEVEALANQLSAVEQLMQMSMEKGILCMDPKSELGTV